MKPSDLQILQKKLAKLQRELNTEDLYAERERSRGDDDIDFPDSSSYMESSSKQRFCIADFDISTTLGMHNSPLLSLIL